MKGQTTIITVFMLAMTLIVLGALMPLILDTISTLTAMEGIDAWTVTIAELIPFVLVVSIVTSAIWYIMPRQQQ